MTTKNEAAPENKFVGAILPWLVAVSGLIFYLATLNHWLSLNNIMQSARSTGMMQMPELYAPLYFLVTYPFRWLPAHWVPIGLNVFSAVCAALTLGLLARSIALLPHDRTHDQRLREEGEFSMLSIRGSWIPPVLAAAVLGLQLTIWEGATTGAKELLDLLLFAYAIRCILEYRISERDSWLFRAAVVYGAGMTGNSVMILLLPAFIFSLVWIRGMSFFSLRFLRVMFLCGLAGLLLYLVLPAVYVNSDYGNGTFWQALKENLKVQRDFLSQIHRAQVNILLLLAITSLLPILLIGIKWASYFGDPSPVGIALTTGIFHLSHGALLGACVWAAFDPTFGPRHMVGASVFAVILIYLGALSIGYFSGYFLLVFIPLRDQSRKIAPWKTVLYRLSQAVVWLLMLLVPAGLIYKNYPRINITNGDALMHYALQLTQNLPERAVVLSDDSTKLIFAESCMARNSKAQDCIFLSTQLLPTPAYFNQQQKLHPDEWLPAADPKNIQGVDPRILMQLLLKLSEKRPVYYLHPSFGYYFELFYPVPRGPVYEMKRYDTNSISPPPLTEAEIAENEAFWKNNEQAANNLLPFISEPAHSQRADFREVFMKKLHIPFEPCPLALALGGYYSLALNVLGVQTQTAGKLQEAGENFERSLKMVPNNISAKRNLEFNKDLQAGIQPSMQLSKQSLKSVEDDFGRDFSGQQILRLFGPFDEPTHRWAQGINFTRAQPGLYHQAAQQFERITKLVPNYLPARLILAKLYVAFNRPEKALAMIPEIRAQTEASAEPGVGKNDILAVEAQALFTANRTEEAERRLRENMEKYPKDVNLLTLVFQISASFKSYTNALLAIEHALEIKPDDIGNLVNKGYIAIQIGDFQKAIPALTTALSIDTNNTPAKLNRAIAYLGAGQLDEARQDYEALEKIFPNAFQVYYGLGEIAWRKKDTNAAIQYYDLYLANDRGAGSDETNTIGQRLESLRTALP
jgi:tetratricopeptide (TPR) repeat protein